MAPKQKPHRSEQVVQTPADFMAAVRGRFGVPNLDVAALPSNALAPRFYTPIGQIRYAQAKRLAEEAKGGK